MGYEYNLDVPLSDVAQADRILRAIHGFEARTSEGLYVFRRAATGEMPDAFASIEPSGIYVCDNGMGHAIVTDIQEAFQGEGLLAELREL